MNKKLIYLAILALVLSHTVLERLIGLFIQNDVKLAADVSVILFLAYILIVPIGLAYLTRLWKIELKKSILTYGLVILGVVIIKTGWMLYSFYPEVLVTEGLFNVVAQVIVPLAVFLGSYKIIEMFLKKKNN